MCRSERVMERKGRGRERSQGTVRRRRRGNVEGTEKKKWRDQEKK